MNTERMVKLFHLTLQSCKLTLAVAGSVVLVTQRGESLIVTDWSVAWASIQSTASKTRYIRINYNLERLTFVCRGSLWVFCFLSSCNSYIDFGSAQNRLVSEVYKLLTLLTKLLYFNQTAHAVCSGFLCLFWLLYIVTITPASATLKENLFSHFYYKRLTQLTIYNHILKKSDLSQRPFSKFTIQQADSGSVLSTAEYSFANN